MNNFKNVTCNKCGYCYFGVTFEYAESEVKRFNEYFDTLPKQQQDDYYEGKGSSMDQYLGCWCGNKWDNFHFSTDKEIPFGSTIGPIIVFTEKFNIKLQKEIK